MRLTASGCLLVGALVLSPIAFGNCAHEATRSATIEGAGVRKVVLATGPGDLTVRGVQAATQVRATGTACAPSQPALDAISIDIRREGDTVFLTSVIPDSRTFKNHGWLDLNVELPMSTGIDLDDSSGDIDVHRVASATINDSSGDQRVHDIAGDVAVTDSSGDIDIRNVRGNVSVRDSSGDIKIQDVAGKLSIPVDSSGGINLRAVRGGIHIVNDSSGDIVITDANQDITIDNDSSGDIRVRDIGGNFTVRNDTSGNIEYRNVLGRVRVPRQIGE